MSSVITEINELDNFPGGIAVGADHKSERLPKEGEWCCGSCEDNRYETWGRRITLPATIIHEPTT